MTRSGKFPRGWEDAVPFDRLQGPRPRQSREERRISRQDFEAALADPDLGPMMTASLQVRGLDPGTIFPGGSNFAIWSKTYTESHKAALFDEVTGNQVAAFGRPPSVTEQTLLSDLSDPHRPE